MASDRDEESGWLTGGRQRGFSPQRQVLTGEHRDIVARIVAVRAGGMEPDTLCGPVARQGLGLAQ